MDYTKLISDYIDLEINILKELDVHDINAAINLLEETRKRDGTIYIFGNGGSSTTASHYVNDFNKGISEHIEQKFRFQCLNDNMATVMAVANDIGFEEVFRFQLLNKLMPEDIVIAISGSGNTKNVLNAVHYARQQKCKVIGLTGYDGGELKRLSDISIHVPVNSMQITEDIQMALDHLMMSVFYKKLCDIEHFAAKEQTECQKKTE